MSVEKVGERRAGAGVRKAEWGVMGVVQVAPGAVGNLASPEFSPSALCTPPPGSPSLYYSCWAASSQSCGAPHPSCSSESPCAASSQVWEEGSREKSPSAAPSGVPGMVVGMTGVRTNVPGGREVH